MAAIERAWRGEQKKATKKRKKRKTKEEKEAEAAASSAAAIGYAAVRTVADDDEEQTLQHTLYRFAVLFSPSATDKAKVLASHVVSGGGPVYDALRSYIKSGAGWERFSADCHRFSVVVGEEPRVSLARRRLRQLGCEGEGTGLDLLNSLCSFHPEQRASMEDVLYSPVFAGLVV